MKTNMSHKATRLFSLSLLAGALLLWTGLLTPPLLRAEADMSAKFIQASGTKLVIEITTGSNPPASVFLIQRLSSEARILDSQPSYINYNTKKNQAKWLLRNLKPGKSKVIRITLDRAVLETGISAEIRFKSEQGWEMTTIQVEK
jgi:hypothetical protein